MKNILKHINITAGILLLGLNIFGQNEYSNLVNKKLIITDSVTKIDSLSIIPETFTINGDTSFQYEVDYLYSKILWKDELPATIYVSYRVFPLSFSTYHRHRDTSVIGSTSSHEKPMRFQAAQPTTNLIELGSLNRNGSISRGVAFGNNQDFSINSNLNLELSGKISDDISILASITDNNLPIQPEGNTQQLQDFDQVYIKLFSDNWSLNAGDFWLKKPMGYFLTFNKRAQGATFSTKHNDLFSNGKYDDVSTSFSTRISAAVSRGKFSRNVIQGIEGNQGPYKLVGAENEPFIIVLSGTERVYIDGKLLVRGQENDYTIDYNTSEIRFTPRQLITKDKRIKVEFQYSDKNYARSIIESSSVLNLDKWKIYLNGYSEQDSKNQPVQQDLDKSERDILTSAGDDLLAALSPSIDSLGYSENQIMYKRVDSLGYQVYVYSNQPDSAVYSMQFSNVGQGNGDYVTSDYNALGKIFSWIAPDTLNGILQRRGNYAPVKVLIAPKLRQMVTFGIERKISKSSFVSTEIAYSNLDLNTFSKLNSEDNAGFASKSKVQLKKGLGSSWKFLSNASAELVTKNFNRIERFRSVEFERDWNILQLQQPGNQFIGEATAGVNHPTNGKVGVSFNTFQISEAYEGYRNSLSAQWNKGVQINYDGSYLLANSTSNSAFIRHKSDVSKQLGFVRIGYKDDFEHNLFKTNDSLLGNSYQYYDWEIYIQNKDSSINRYRVFYKERTDYLAGSSSLIRTTLARNPGISFEFNQNKQHRFRIKSMYRNLEIVDTSLTSIAPDNTLLNRVEYNLRILNGGVTLSTFYELGSGLELKKQFIYLEVPAGQGVYTWIDYNNDNIKELNEFELAAFPDQATYIRVFTPTNEYIKVFSNQFNQALNINPRYFIKNKKGFAGLIRRFNLQTSIRKEKKVSQDEIESIANPFISDIADSTLRSLSSSFRNSTFFNRSNPIFGLEHSFSSFQSKLLLVNGFDSRDKISNEYKLRWSITRQFLINIKFEDLYKINASDYAPTRNYTLHNQESELKLSFQPNSSFRAAISGEYKDKKNALELGGESAYVTNLGAEIKYNQLRKGALLANFNYIQIHYTGNTNSSLAFEMLEALQPGTNFTWNVSLQRTLANNLQLTFNYTGRKSEESKAIHTGGVQVRAFF